MAVIWLDKPFYSLNTKSAETYYRVDSKIDSKRITKCSTHCCRNSDCNIVIYNVHLGFDQGYLFSMNQGQQAFDVNWMHEFYHV